METHCREVGIKPTTSLITLITSLMTSLITMAPLRHTELLACIFRDRRWSVHRRLCGFDSYPGPSCVKLACSSCVCMSSLLQLPGNSMIIRLNGSSKFQLIITAWESNAGRLQPPWFQAPDGRPSEQSRQQKKKEEETPDCVSRQLFSPIWSSSGRNKWPHLLLMQEPQSRTSWRERRGCPAVNNTAAAGTQIPTA